MMRWNWGNLEKRDEVDIVSIEYRQGAATEQVTIGYENDKGYMVYQIVPRQAIIHLADPAIDALLDP